MTSHKTTLPGFGPQCAFAEILYNGARGRRQLSYGERARIGEQYRSPHIDAGLGEVIDNSGQSPEETLALIRTSLGVKEV